MKQQRHRDRHHYSEFQRPCGPKVVWRYRYSLGMGASAGGGHGRSAEADRQPAFRHAPVNVASDDCFCSGLVIPSENARPLNRRFSKWPRNQRATSRR